MVRLPLGQLYTKFPPLPLVGDVYLFQIVKGAESCVFC
jgi:hypothetical protein